MIDLTVNGEPRQLHARTVAALVEELGHDPGRRGIAIAVNDEVVPRSGWAERTLAQGDRIEVVGAVQGG